MTKHRVQRVTAMWTWRPTSPASLGVGPTLRFDERRARAKMPGFQTHEVPAGPRQTPPRSDGSILIVEDDEDNREALADILDDEGYPVRTAANGREALDGMADGPLPALILLDLMMPVMDGWEFLQRQRQDPRLADIPVVILSGAADLGLDRLPSSPAAYFTKPVNLDALLLEIEHLCG